MRKLPRGYRATNRKDLYYFVGRIFDTDLVISAAFHMGEEARNHARDLSRRFHEDVFVAHKIPNKAWQLVVVYSRGRKVSN